MRKAVGQASCLGSSVVEQGSEEPCVVSSILTPGTTKIPSQDGVFVCMPYKKEPLWILFWSGQRGSASPLGSPSLPSGWPPSRPTRWCSHMAPTFSPLRTPNCWRALSQQKRLQRMCCNLFGRARGARTLDLLVPNQARYQLRYSPMATFRTSVEYPILASM